MKIYADENMPFVEAFFSYIPNAQVSRFAGRACQASTIADADVLLVRSVTDVNESLLSEAKNLKFVGTATIGTDHVDQAYLAARGIPFASSPGCNAASVGQYVLSAIKVLEQRYGFSLQDKFVGIVGAGNTGSALANLLDGLGVKYILCDPPLAAKKALNTDQQDNGRTFAQYDTLLSECDIISFHVPIIKDGAYPTYHLFGERQLQQIKSDAILINACRGEVMDNQALLKAKQQGCTNPLVLDVWENEPHPLHALIPFADIATAHIAGYSLEGKARGTLMLFHALCELLDIDVDFDCNEVLPSACIHQVNIDNDAQLVDFYSINRLIHLVYDVRRDDSLFRQNIEEHGFDWLRKNYPVRREFSSLVVKSKLTKTAATLEALNFNMNIEQ